MSSCEIGGPRKLAREQLSKGDIHSKNASFSSVYNRVIQIETQKLNTRLRLLRNLAQETSTKEGAILSRSQSKEQVCLKKASRCKCTKGFKCKKSYSEESFKPISSLTTQRFEGSIDASKAQICIPKSCTSSVKTVKQIGRDSDTKKVEISQKNHSEGEFSRGKDFPRCASFIKKIEQCRQNILYHLKFWDEKIFTLDTQTKLNKVGTNINNRSEPKSNKLYSVSKKWSSCHLEFEEIFPFQSKKAKAFYLKNPKTLTSYLSSCEECISDKETDMLNLLNDYFDSKRSHDIDLHPEINTIPTFKAYCDLEIQETKKPCLCIDVHNDPWTMFSQVDNRRKPDRKSQDVKKIIQLLTDRFEDMHKPSSPRSTRITESVEDILLTLMPSQSDCQPEPFSVLSDDI